MSGQRRSEGLLEHFMMASQPFIQTEACSITCTVPLLLARPSDICTARFRCPESGSSAWLQAQKRYRVYGSGQPRWSSPHLRHIMRHFSSTFLVQLSVRLVIIGVPMLFLRAQSPSPDSPNYAAKQGCVRTSPPILLIGPWVSRSGRLSSITLHRFCCK
jgi:hypothetical protein